VKRTTIMADEGLLLEAQQLATQRGISFTALVHEALQEYVAAHHPQRRLSFIGVGRSGERYPLDAESGWEETVLAAAAQTADDWSHPAADQKQHGEQQSPAS
jgi:hypothetical protein